ncbi:MAG: 30S ribosome-binding factor RbfA [Pseudomonadota bacterium]
MRAHRSEKGPSQRQLRAGELVRHELAQMFQREEVHDDRLSGRSVTVTEVTASPDLKQATVFVTTLGGFEVEETVIALRDMAPKIRGVLAPKLSMKFIPQLRFEKDESFDRADRISELLKGNS